MFDAGNARQIVKQYEKHGWILRRVLLCAAEDFSRAADSFGGASIVRAGVDALWFSRAADDGNEAWELRRLSGAPFALLNVFSPTDDDAARERMRCETETKMENGKRKMEN